MELKNLISIFLGIVALISFLIFLNSSQDPNKFTMAVFSCLVTSGLVVIILVLNPWLVGKR